MGRNKELTIWQLSVLVKSAELAAKGEDPPPTLTDVAAALGASRQQVVGAIERLEQALAPEEAVGSKRRLVEERPDGLYIANPALVEPAERIVRELEEIRREASAGAGRWWITCDGYWAHLSLFLAEAILDLEDEHKDVHVELASQFGEARGRGGSGLPTGVRWGDVDLAIAPSSPDEIPGVVQRRTHRVNLLAAVGPDHPLQERAHQGRLWVRDLATRGPDDTEITVLTSPKGHFSRDLLDLYQSGETKFRTEVVGTEPLALAALGRCGPRTPIVASDSALSWLGYSDDDKDTSLPSSWLYLHDDEGKPLGREYSLYHRTFISKTDRRKPEFKDTRSVPQQVDVFLRLLADRIVDLAGRRLDVRSRMDEELSEKRPSTRGRPRR